MTDNDWKIFLATARRILGKGSSVSWASESWCAFTSFSSLEHWLTYWTNGLPDEEELLEGRTEDGGLWRQSFYYNDLAHIILPARFYWERIDSETPFTQVIRIKISNFCQQSWKRKIYLIESPIRYWK